MTQPVLRGLGRELLEHSSLNEGESKAGEVLAVTLGIRNGLQSYFLTHGRTTLPPAPSRLPADCCGTEKHSGIHSQMASGPFPVCEFQPCHVRALPSAVIASALQDSLSLTTNYG